MKVDEYLLSFVLEILLVLQLLLLQGRQEFVVSKVFLERIFLGNFSWICHTFFFCNLLSPISVRFADFLCICKYIFGVL